MRRYRHLLMIAAVLVLGGLLAFLPGVFNGLGDGTPAEQARESQSPDAEPTDELASLEADVPPPDPVKITGVVTKISMDESGLLTVSGKTEADGAPVDVPVTFWIDRSPAPAIALPAPASVAEVSDLPMETTVPETSGTEAAVPETAAAETTVPSIADESGRFARAVQLREGPQEVCAIAKNDAGPDAILGCEQVMFRAQLVEGKLIVADYGSGATPRLGVAGEGTPLEAAERVAARARDWEEKTGIPTIPAFDYIQTVAQASSGSDGDYSAHTSREDLDEYLAAIRTVSGLLILDFQPGGSHFMKQVAQYEDYFRQPDVGLALDTEWRMPWGVAPATIIGYADASEINEVGEYLAGIVAEDNLPQKAFVVHQFRSAMVRNRSSIVDRPELATIFHIDGHGTKQLKQTVYRQLLPEEHFYTGFKLFFDEDTGLMTPLEVRDDLARIPAMISYQ